MAINVVLVEPEIPQNTGNIARTCGATGASLHLVKPLGFSVNDKYLKRAGLDYWHLLDIHYYDCFEDLLEKYPDRTFFYSTTKAKNTYSEMKFNEDCFLVFGKETAGLPEDLLNLNKETAMRIPMVQDERARSLNLSNAVNIVLYEALRQIGFPNLK